jgi:hypothetical protein
MLFATRLAFKHKCFKSEQEIRAVFIYPRYVPEEIKEMGAGKEIQAPEITCRIKNGITIPYFDYNMKDLKNKIPVNSITLSPLYPLTEEEGIRNIKDFLFVQGYAEAPIKISKSKLPLRYY